MTNKIAFYFDEITSIINGEKLAEEVFGWGKMHGFKAQKIFTTENRGWGKGIKNILTEKAQTIYDEIKANQSNTQTQSQEKKPRNFLASHNLFRGMAPVKYSLV